MSAAKTLPHAPKWYEVTAKDKKTGQFADAAIAYGTPLVAMNEGRKQIRKAAPSASLEFAARPLSEAEVKVVEKKLKSGDRDTKGAAKFIVPPPGGKESGMSKRGRYKNPLKGAKKGSKKGRGGRRRNPEDFVLSKADEKAASKLITEAEHTQAVVEKKVASGTYEGGNLLDKDIAETAKAIDIALDKKEVAKAKVAEVKEAMKAEQAPGLTKQQKAAATREKNKKIREAEAAQAAEKKAAANAKRQATRLANKAKGGSGGTPAKKTAKKAAKKTTKKAPKKMAAAKKSKGMTPKKEAYVKKLQGLVKGQMKRGNKKAAASLRKRIADVKAGKPVTKAKKAKKSATARATSKSPSKPKKTKKTAAAKSTAKSGGKGGRKSGKKSGHKGARTAGLRVGKRELASLRKRFGARYADLQTGKVLTKKQVARHKNPTADSTSIAMTVVGVILGGVTAMLVDRFVATRAANGKHAWMGRDAFAKIVQRPGAMRLGAQIGVGVLFIAAGGMTGKGRKMALAGDLLWGVGAGMIAHAASQAVASYFLPMIFKVEKGDELSLGNRLIPEMQIAPQDALKALNDHIDTTADYVGQTSAEALDPSYQYAGANGNPYGILPDGSIGAAAPPAPPAGTDVANPPDTAVIKKSLRRNIGMRGIPGTLEGDVQQSYLALEMRYAEAAARLSDAGGCGCPNSSESDCGCGGQGGADCGCGGASKGTRWDGMPRTAPAPMAPTSPEPGRGSPVITPTGAQTPQYTITPTGTRTPVYTGQPQAVPVHYDPSRPPIVQDNSGRQDVRVAALRDNPAQTERLLPPAYSSESSYDDELGNISSTQRGRARAMAFVD